MKRFSIFCLLLFLKLTFLGGQCSGEIELSTQMDIDNFSTNYPECTEVEYLYIYGSDITDLSGLSHIQHVDKSLTIFATSISSLAGIEHISNGDNLEIYIESNSLLEAIDGFDNISGNVVEIYLVENTILESVSGFNNVSSSDYIQLGYNESLVTVNGFQNLEFANDIAIELNESLVAINTFNDLQNPEGVSAVVIYGNDSLSDIEGFNNSIFLSVEVSYNSALQEISGFNNLEVEQLYIRDNTQLWNMSGIEEAVFGQFSNLYIRNNTELSICNIASICNWFEYDQFGIFENNKAGCNSVEEVSASCGNCQLDILVDNYDYIIQLCEGECVDIGVGVNEGAFGEVSYVWSDGQEGSLVTLCPTVSTSYSVVGTDGLTGCQDTSFSEILVQASPVFSIEGPVFYCEGETTELYVESDEVIDQYLWSTGETSEIIEIESAGTYGVTVTDLLGCTGSLEIDVIGFNNFNNWESGWGIWNDGGDDAAISSNATYANTGVHSLLIKDNTSTSIATTSSLDLSAATEITIDFNFITTGFNNEAQLFYLEISNDDGTNFEIIEQWSYLSDFENEIRYFESTVYTGSLSDKTQLRLRCDATGNNDKVYIDDINISACNPFVPCTDFDFNDVETDWGIWNDGGADAARSAKAEFANSGTYTFLIKDNTSTSHITTDALDLEGYYDVSLEFSFITEGFDNQSQDFWLQVSTDNGSSFENIAEWHYNDEFTNGERWDQTVAVLNELSVETKFRFVCDATGNNDKVYIDDILITGCTDDGLIEPIQSESRRAHESTVRIYPNPIRQNNALTVELPTDHEFTALKLYDLSGRQMINQIITANQQMLNLEMDQLNAGTYILKLTGATDVFVEKVMVVE